MLLWICFKITTEFIKKSDSITDFIDRTLVKKEGAILKLHDVTNRYINWYTTTINSHIKLSIDEVKTKMLNSKLTPNENASAKK